MHSQILKIDYEKRKEHWHFFCSDLHFGNKGQNRKALKKDFDLAKERNAKIYINGDWGDFIMSGDRKRYHPSSDAYGTDNNINMTINDAYDFLSNYATQIVFIGCGNHEVSVQKFNNFDPTQQLIYSLNKEHKTQIQHGQYAGFILLKYHVKEGQVRTYKIFYNHGQGGSAEISKGTIGLNRHMSTKNADLVWLGHSHTKVLLPSEYILDVNMNGEIHEKERCGMITASYINVAGQYDAMKEGYKINYGEEHMRGLQAVGGIFMSHTLGGQDTVINRRFEL
jgi:UDP-2,3-diacylglucosamine pyrophosphatase LpxH